MNQPTLSQDARAALAAVQQLPEAVQAKLPGIISLDRANPISAAAEKSTPAQLAEASAQLVEGVKAARAHGFKQVTAPDGTKAIEVRTKRINGEEVTRLLSEGARDKLFTELKDYGKDKLGDATLLSTADFWAVAGSLHWAIKGMKVANGALQTEDAALKQAYQIVTQGVRTKDGYSISCFDLDDGGVVGGSGYGGVDGCEDGVEEFVNFCALFGAAPAKSE
jgi:hypothetical protein